MSEIVHSWAFLQIYHEREGLRKWRKEPCIDKFSDTKTPDLDKKYVKIEIVEDQTPVQPGG